MSVANAAFVPGTIVCHAPLQTRRLLGHKSKEAMPVPVWSLEQVPYGMSLTKGLFEIMITCTAQIRQRNLKPKVQSIPKHLA